MFQKLFVPVIPHTTWGNDQAVRAPSRPSLGPAPRVWVLCSLVWTECVAERVDHSRPSAQCWGPDARPGCARCFVVPTFGLTRCASSNAEPRRGLPPGVEAGPHPVDLVVGRRHGLGPCRWHQPQRHRRLDHAAPPPPRLSEPLSIKNTAGELKRRACDA